MRELRPSNAYRWMRCPGSAALIEQLDAPDYQSYEAAEGTAAHELAAWALEQDCACRDRLGDVIEVEGREHDEEPFRIEVSEEMVGHVQAYANHVMARAEQAMRLKVEVRLALDYVIHEGRTGTADVLMADDPDTLRVIDLKYGRGIEVDAEDNEQLMIYALGALDYWEFLDFQEVVVEIYQPRLDANPTVTLSREELEAFRTKAREKADEALNASSPEHLVADAEGQCKFCPAARVGRCPALDKLTHDVVFDDLTGDGDVNLAPLSIEALAERRKWVDTVKLWLKGVTDGVHQALEAGHTVPGWTLDRGRAGNRKWANLEDAEAELKRFRLKKDEMYDFKLISPTQAEKILSPKRYEKLVDQNLVTRDQGSLKVVRAEEDDGRSLIDDFDDETEE